MNRLPIDRRAQIINALVEGNSIRSTERMLNVHRDTIMRLMVEVGNGCATIMDEQMRDLLCERIQVDEIWSYVGKHQRFMRPHDDQRRVGDMWTFVALDPDTKLVPAYLVGKRTVPNTVAFIHDLSERLANRVQLTSDAMRSYVDAVEWAFGADVDYAQSVKFYETEPTGPGRYSPPRVTHHERRIVTGRPDPKHISTSLVERQNLTMRMSMRRLTRLTNAFSKKVENLRAAVGLHFAHYNFVRIHRSLRIAPAMAAGVSDHLWSMEELIERIDAMAPPPKPRGPYKKRAA
jgi:IS1 family transposase